MKKRILAVFLTLVMALSLLPVNALAKGPKPGSWEPDRPNEVTVARLLGESITVRCKRDNDHAAEKYAVTTGSVVSIGKVNWTNYYGYTCVVTISPDSYVSQYSKTYGNHNTNDKPKTATLYWDSWEKEWRLSKWGWSWTIDVTCDTEAEKRYPVYVYCQVFDSNENPLDVTGTLSAVEGVEATLNGDGWITLGMIAAATTYNPQNSIYDQYKSTSSDRDRFANDHPDEYNAVIAQLSDMDRYEEYGIGAENVGSWQMVQANGASDYPVDRNEKTWHLDGKVTAYKVTYDANGGTGSTVSTNYYLKGVNVKVKDNMFEAPSGYEFAGWNTSRDGAGTDYSANEEIKSISSDTTLYAIWEEKTVEYTVTGTIDNGTVSRASQTVEHGKPCIDIVFTPDTGYKITAVKVNGTEVGDFDLVNGVYTYSNANVTKNISVEVTTAKDDSQTQETKYTVRYTVEGVERTADKIEVTGAAWINDDPAKIAIAEGGIPTPADKYTGYKLDPANPAYPTAGTEVNSGSEYTVNYVKDESKTQETKYTVRYTVEGVERTADKIEVTGTAWINDDPAKIAIAEGGIPTPADKYTGYKLDPANPAYPTAGTEVNSGSVFTVNYVKNDPTPGTFDFDDAYDDGTFKPAITKTVKGNVGKNFEETFIVLVKPESKNAGATMSFASYTGRADVTYNNVKDVPFLFKPE